MRRMLIVLHNGMEFGGIETYLLNTLAKIERSELQIDIFVPGEVVSREIASRFEDLGCTIYPQSISGGKLRKAEGLAVELNRFLRIRQYDVIYVNTGNIVRQAIAISVAKKHGIKVRIAHSHGAVFTNNSIKKTFYRFLQRMIVKNATHLAACSNAAAAAHFGEDAEKRTVIVRNGIDTKKFRYREESRVYIRKKLGLEHDFVIGHVGRFNVQKNHRYLIEIFRSLSERNMSAKLLLVGAGELEGTVRAMVDDYELSERVIFAGATDHVEDYLCAMDVFVLPSLFEGLPFVGVEAQVSGLPCMIADSVTEEVKLTEQVEFVPLEAGPDIWGDKILQVQSGNRTVNRTIAWEKIRDSGYDISNTAQTLQKMLEGSG